MGHISDIQAVNVQTDVCLDLEIANSSEEPEQTQDDDDVPTQGRSSSGVLSTLLADYCSSSNSNPRSVNSTMRNKHIRDEMTRYLEEPACNLESNPLEWWKSKAHIFPVLSRYALPYMCLQGTSVASERLFSTAGDVVSKKRNRLSSNMINMIMVLNRNHCLIDAQCIQ